MRDLSVVVPTHNGRQFLPRLLASLAAQRYPAERWELIIVDDGSVDGTREWVAAGGGPRPLHTTCIYQARGGLVVARNTGARVATGHALLFLADDAVAAPTLVAEHVAAHRIDPDAVVIGRLSASPVCSSPWMAWEDARVYKHYARLDSGVQPGPRDFFSANCSVAAGLFHAIGGFCAAPAAAADQDLGYRLATAGANFYYRPAADSTRVRRDSFADWVSNARTCGQSDARLARDDGGADLRDVFRWFQLRGRPNRVLLRLCSAAPALESPAIGLLHASGLLGCRFGRAPWTAAIYSAIHDLAYWQALSASLGRSRFWAGVAQADAGASTPCAAEPGAAQSPAGL